MNSKSPLIVILLTSIVLISCQAVNRLLAPGITPTPLTISISTPEDTPVELPVKSKSVQYPLLGFGLEVPQGWYVQENTPTGSESLVITSFDPASPPHKLEWDSQTVSIEIIPISPEFAPTSLDAWVENARQTAISSQLELFNEERFLLGQDTPAIRLTLVSGSGGVIDQVLTILNHHNLEILVQGNFELARSVLSSIYSIPALDAVRTFAGEDYEVAVVPEKAQALLTRYDARSQHYELRAEMKGSA